MKSAKPTLKDAHLVRAHVRRANVSLARVEELLTSHLDRDELSDRIADELAIAASQITMAASYQTPPPAEKAPPPPSPEPDEEPVKGGKGKGR